MKLLTAPALALAILLGGGASAEPSCPAQPMPPAIDSAGELPPRSHVIAFAASPGEHPRRAWVVRVSRRGDAEATVEIVRLLGRSDCNRWDVETRWQAPLGPDEFRSVARAVERFGLPPAGLVSSDDSSRDDLVLDGTGVQLRLEAQGWTVTRTLNHYGRGGAELSAIFHRLFMKHVPSSERPAADWRRR